MTVTASTHGVHADPRKPTLGKKELSGRGNRRRHQVGRSREGGKERKGGAQPVTRSDTSSSSLRASASLLSVRESQSVDHASEMVSSQAGTPVVGTQSHGSALEAATRTRRNMTRADSRRSDEDMRSASSRLMSRGVRRELVLSRWEILVTRLRAESPKPPRVHRRPLG